jgi:hypothetical protein
LKDLELQFEEFQITSKEVEQELEEEVQTKTKKLTEALSNIQRLEANRDSILVPV